ncbi:hypothetical protein J2Z40_003864 [Cytobacillus eiseniae]|uniref:YhfM-like domain-containing protein n=1 Tax=Cytobacillus eiseniae TaxID=762947 RepID=A0ABS4RK31_9BACI|nr:hypothetical protein [Cytobacillus eiseniae]MBP2243265.1 hypothetical protein [Cytobacillus eiseniae]
MKAVISIVSIIFVSLILAACQTEQAETMVLLDEKISEVKISESKGFGGMNEETIQTFKDKKSLDIFKMAITTAIKQPQQAEIAEPEYDVMVEYESDKGELPTHGIHLLLGKENEKSMFMYITDDSAYLTSPKMTMELRKLILSEE